MNEPLKGFITYSHEDTEAKHELRKRLAVMEQQNAFVTWDDGQLTPGDKALQEDILKEVVDSDLLLYLVSAASLASKNCNRELATALKREVRVIPIILEHCDWLHHQLSGFEVLPHKGKPISKWEDESEGWQNVVAGIRKAIDQMQAQVEPSSESAQNRQLVEWVFQQGNFLVMLGALDRAIEAYSYVLDLNPNHALAYSNRGAAYGTKGETDRAIKDFNEAIKLNPGDAVSYNNRGNAYREKGDVDIAIENHDKAIKLNPDYAEAYMSRGVAYREKGDVDIAIENLNKSIQLDPNDALAYYNRGNIYRDKNASDIAITNYTKAIKLKTDFAEAYNVRGITYKDKHKLDNAIEDLNKAIQLRPDYVEAYYNLGNVYDNKGELDNTIENCNRAIQLRPNYAEAYTTRGIARGKKGEFDNAIEDFNTAIQLKPELAEAYNNRGNARVYKGEFDNAIVDYTQAMQLKTNYAEAYNNRGVAYGFKGEYNLAIVDYTQAMQLKTNYAEAYNNRGVAYFKKMEVNRAIEDYTMAIELEPDYATSYYNRGEAWLHQREWEKARVDMIAAKRIGMDVIAAFHGSYKNVGTYEQRHRVKLPEDIVLLLTQRRRTRYPKTQKVLDAEGNPIESSNVVNLREQLRNVSRITLGKYVKTKPAFGLNTSPTEAFVVDRAMRDKLIAAHPSSVDILKPFLQGQDLRRWHVNIPHRWLIFTHRRVAIKDYPAILNHLENHRESLKKRKGKQKWYELQASLRDVERFAQPKLVCPDTYNHQTFAVDTAGYYYDKTAYLIPTEEKWLCGLLNSRTVEWFYSQVSKQLTINPLRARSGYIQQIPIPDLTATQKGLLSKIVDYLIYLQQQPTTNSTDLAHARDAVMLGYFERIIDGLVYESYLPEDLQKGNKHFFQPLLEEQLPLCEEIQGDKMPGLRDIFEMLYERTHLVRRNLFFLDSVKPIRIIEGKL